MAKEYEAKFLDIDKDLMTQKLKSIGAKLVHEKKRYVRSVFKLCTDNVKGYARVRDEAGIITMTVKIYKDPKFPEEYEIEIKNDFETGVKFLSSLGINQKAFQETYREKWVHDLAHEITFDDIPGLPTYMEIDCTSEEKLNKLIEMLNLDKSKMRFGAFDKTYNEYYGIETTVINDQTPFLTFKNIINEITPLKNHDLLKKMQEKYNKEYQKGGFSKRELKLFKQILDDENNKKSFEYKYKKYKTKYINK
ncbi:adenylate cyclase class IV CYTH domain protein [Fadolivirus algeromassiliense]|jgi:adenylate cyclase class IV|uniref:Adenylate cyclase class IV CYTH domain protein n=1 Tax=Fadolivirus FV1/VV64 TaxID=3070911 RepID=A0A7D3UQX1_9VIRU|nr:adenylate cyclase class IV CYTH domain protein [Fadolivirus algeromassiliense]QKF94788.1 adenylate cyclase class IV CYTH domain protein [Fadolivirus FV1/VV64]